MRDRYSHWYKDALPFKMPISPTMMPNYRDLEHLVIQDLDKAQTESEKIEILDSYSLASQRKYRGDLRREITDMSQQFLGRLIAPVLEVNLPQPEAPWHTRAFAVDPTEEKSKE